MNWRAIRAIVVRDLRLVARAKAVMVPLIIVPVMFFVIFPDPQLPCSRGPQHPCSPLASTGASRHWLDG